MPEALHYWVTFKFIVIAGLTRNRIKSELLNNQKAGLLRCNTPRNDSKTRASCRVGKALAFPPRKAAFTLAEVLITLGIIGVVAALTLPALIAKYQKKETVAKLKKNYSTVTQAIRRSEADNGEMRYWDFSLSSAKFNNKYIKPYFKVIKEYPNLQQLNYHTLGTDGQNHDIFFQYFSNPTMILNDGTMITIHKEQSANNQRFVTLVIDLNGHRKPNQYGKDLFAISVQEQGQIVPYGVGHVFGGTIKLDYNRDELVNGNDYRACNKRQGGAFCTALIIMDGWEIKDDYPW